MNGQPTQKVTGTIVRVEFEGQGPGSGSLTIALEPVHLAFEVYMDTPRVKYFELFEHACSAMWDNKQVEITYVVSGGKNMAIGIREA